MSARFAVLLLLAGCAGGPRPVRDAFPPGASAAPWILQGDVWSGTFDQAAPALGDDAPEWQRHGPTRIWLARYCHEQHPDRCLTVRGFAFASVEDARRAYESLRPADAQAFRAGTAGCWTEIGVLFQDGRLVFDILGPQAGWDSQIQAALLASFLANRMPAGAAEQPR